MTIRSRGNFYEEIYTPEEIEVSRSGEINRVIYQPSGEWRSFLDSHPAYLSDLLAFQHIELWISNLTLKNNEFIIDKNRKTPIIFTSRIGSNYQSLFNPINLHLGSVNYKFSDFETQESVHFDKVFISRNKPESLPHLFKSKNNHNGIFLDEILISMRDNFLDKNLLELKIEDKNLTGRLLFKTKWFNFENAYAESENSGENRWPIKNFKSKRFLRFIKKESFLKYNNQEIPLESCPSMAYVDESYGFPPKKKNWDWMIFKSNSSFFKKDIRLIIGKQCQRAGYSKIEQNEIATLFVNGKIHRLKGIVKFDYDVKDITLPWKISFFDFHNPKQYNIEVETNYIAPKIEESLMNEGIGPIKVSLDLQRILAESNVKITLDGKKIKSAGISSLESNKGIERGTKYFDD